MSQKPRTYEDSGVSIQKGDDFASWIGSIKSPALAKADIGGFAGGIEIDTAKFKKPIMLSTTDGVGTKLLVAKKLGKFDTVGIDLVAMCVNDLAVCGAQPLVFLDYIALGKIDEQLLKDIITGVVKGCELADCTLSGGETAEMPDVYRVDDFDLAGFCSGVVDKDRMLPKKDRAKAGDPIFGIASSGVHSNGFSLARKALANAPKEIWEELLTPTRIYVRELVTLAETGLLNGAAHITGGGLEGNFERVIPKQLKAEFTWDWPVPPIFERIQHDGPVETAEMRKVFNMGVGIALTCNATDASKLIAKAESIGTILFQIGTLANA